MKLKFKVGKGVRMGGDDLAAVQLEVGEKTLVAANEPGR